MGETAPEAALTFPPGNRAGIAIVETPFPTWGVRAVMSVDTVRVTAGARAHFGFLNLSLAHERLYGGIGVALEKPQVTVTATRADRLHAPDLVQEYARRSVDILGVPGADVSVETAIPRHVGLGSGTQHALATCAAIAGAYGRTVEPRAVAPDLGRGGRSGVGVGAFETGGFLVDGGHPTERFTTARPPDGEWTVPPVVARHDVPQHWRFLLVLPDVDPGRSGRDEDRSIRSVVERADGAVGNRIAGILARRLLPSVPADDPATFGEAISEIGRLNGGWYADEQGGVYRPPAGSIVDHMAGHPAVLGATQSSWGPTTVGVTTADRAPSARQVGQEALASSGLDGTVRMVRAHNDGVSHAPDAGP